MNEIKVIHDCDEDSFTKKINDLLKDGYKLSSSSCGFIDSAEEVKYPPNRQTIEISIEMIRQIHHKAFDDGLELGKQIGFNLAMHEVKG